MSKKANAHILKRSKSEDLSLARKLHNGDPYAFRTLFTMHYQSLVNYARRYVRDVQTAEDIVGDVFLKIWDKRSELNITTSLKAYLFKMVHNHSINYLKSHKVEATDVFSLSLVIRSNLMADAGVNADELRQSIEQAIRELPERTRDVFTMHRYDDLKYKEIAEILNIKEGTVETHMVRALKYLRKRLAFLLAVFVVLGKA